jgi:hypothetical protein
MAGAKVFSGPPSNKATAATIAAALATLFWTIAAHTFWKSMSNADLTLYVATSTTILTAAIGFLVPESAAYTAHNQQRLLDQQATKDSATISSAIEAAIKAQIRQLQAQQNPAGQGLVNVVSSDGGPS